MQRFKRILWPVLVAGLLAWSAGSTAQAVVKGDDKKPANTGLFGEMDKNGDGKVTKEEFMAFYGHAFDQMKKDGQGNVTVESVTVYYSARFKFLDKNGDGVITKDEYATTPGMDTNRDGKVTLDEWSAFLVAEITVMDADKDGKVTPQEYNAYCDARFKALDANGDGVVVLKEWLAPRPPAAKGAKAPVPEPKKAK